MYNNICMLGACGAGMAPLAIYLSQKGHNVYAWDDNVNFEIKDMLNAHKVVFLPKKFLPANCDCIVRSSAVNEQVDEICKEGAKKGIKIFRRGEFFAKACEGKKLIAVVGSHGKTSVSGNCVEILKNSGMAVDYMVGGFFKNNAFLPAEFHTHSEWIIAEIDESDRTMENFSPECTIALNYDDDHICNYGSKEALMQAFKELFGRTMSKIFVPADDEIFSGLANDFHKKYIKIENLNQQNFPKRNLEIAKFCTQEIFGHQVDEPATINGIKRRNDVMLETDHFTFINDYAHHPTELDSLLKYARQKYQDYELNIVFQPHRLSRTKQYFKEFAEILSKFDRTFILELYTAFEEKMDGVSSNLVFDNITNSKKQLLSLAGFNGTIHEIVKDLNRSAKRQVVMFVGAGNILSHAKIFVKEILFDVTEKLLLKSKIKFSKFENLQTSFSIRVNTSARIYAEPETSDDLSEVIKICKKTGTKLIIIGNGTKILPPDKIIEGVVVKLKSAFWRTAKWLGDDTLYCSSGMYMSEICNLANEKLYSGVEKLAFIPCCLGGAIFMNAGSHGQSISDCLVSIDTIDTDGNKHTIEKSKLKFSYRRTSVPKGHVIAGATFRFKERADRKYFESSYKELSSWRKTHQPKGANFGSVFKNGDDFCAGKLIDEANLKGMKIGGAEISTEHGNFIINSNHASSKDIEQLIDTARYETFSRFGKFLETEINILRT